MSLLVVRALGLVTVQDLGRTGRMHEALPAGGALVPSMLVRANRAVRNLDGVAAIEVCGQLVVRAERATDLGLVDGTVVALFTGDELVVESAPHRVAYLAVRGGVDAPVIVGGRGAHLSAGIGALLRSGDRVPIADERDVPANLTAPAVHRREICVLAGPDLDAFPQSALDSLVHGEWTISSTSNRVGTRLDGGRIERRADHVEQSRPMVIGAIEVPRDGAPIVLGPEHPTTGGYPIVAVVASDSLDAFHSIPLGGRVRFRV
ncbi:MAG: biotin-dependent carboxyltransferase family protein [Kofleriaceae bacterium]